MLTFNMMQERTRKCISNKEHYQMNEHNKNQKIRHVFNDDQKTHREMR